MGHGPKSQRWGLGAEPGCRSLSTPAPGTCIGSPSRLEGPAGTFRSRPPLGVDHCQPGAAPRAPPTVPSWGLPLRVSAAPVPASPKAESHVTDV